MADPETDVFLALKEKGNQLFRDSCERKGPIFKLGMLEAIECYNQALRSASTIKDRASILKNIAAAQFRLSQRIQKGIRNKKSSRRGQMKKEILYYSKESLRNAQLAIQEGAETHGQLWTIQLQGRCQKCANSIWSYLTNLFTKEDASEFSVLSGRLHQFCSDLDGQLRAKFFLKLGQFTLVTAVRLREVGLYKESIQLLADNNLAIEEGKKFYGRGVLEAEELVERTHAHLCIGYSAMARQKGDALWASAVGDKGALDMDLVWAAVDSYRQAILNSREKCLESEAMSHCKLGQLYKSLRNRQKSREHFQTTVDLELQLRPKNLTHTDWHKSAVDGLNTFQQEDLWTGSREKEKIRAPIRSELKEVLNELEMASEQSAAALVKYLYEKHPPKRGSIFEGVQFSNWNWR